MNSLLISKPIKTGDDSREEALDNAERFSNLVFKR
jgi:hypothetical protein